MCEVTSAWGFKAWGQKVFVCGFGKVPFDFTPYWEFSKFLKCHGHFSPLFLSFSKVSALFQMSIVFSTLTGVFHPLLKVHPLTLSWSFYLSWSLPFPEVLSPVIRLYKLSFVFRRRCINVFVSLKSFYLFKVRGNFPWKFFFSVFKACFHSSLTH